MGSAHGFSKKNEPRFRRLLKVAGLALAGALGLVLLSAQMTPSEQAQRVARNEAMGMRGVIKGRVTYADGSPAVGFAVGAGFQMHKTGAPGEGFAVTDGDGRYEIRGLAKDRFQVGVSNGGKPYLQPAIKLIDLTKKSSASGIDFVLRLGPEVHIQVRDAETGAPVPGLRLDNHWEPFGSGRVVVTDAKGEIHTRMGSLRFSLSLSDPNESRKYGQAPGYFFAKEFDLKKVETVRWNTLAYRNWVEDRPATFSGVVVDESNRPVPDARVQLIRGGSPQVVKTDSLGTFRFETRRIRDFENDPGGAVLIAEKGNKAVSLMAKAADTWKPMRLMLVSGVYGQLTGRIVDERGKPLPFCNVSYVGFWGSSFAQPSVTGDPGKQADAQGRFVIPNLFPQCGYSLTVGTQFAGGKLGQTIIPANALKGHYVRVAPGQTKDLGTIMVPRADRVIVGQLLDPSGRPVTKDVIVIVKGAHTYLPANPDKAGKFRLEGLVDEPLTVGVFGGRNGGYRTSDDSPDKLLARPIGRKETTLRLVVKPRRVAP